CTLGESIPGRVVVGGRDAPLAPSVSPEFHRDLEDRECVRPGREAAGAAITVELRRHRDDGGGRSLAAEVVEFGTRDLRVEVAATVRLSARGAKQEVVQPGDGTSALDARRPEAVDPRPRLDVELLRQSRRALRSL